MVSDVDGNAINTQLRNSLAVNVTLGMWGVGQAHDLGILNGYASMPHALNIPYSMWSNSNGNPFYKNWVGGAVMNFGTSTETNVSVYDSVVWTGTGSGTSSLEHQANYSIASIAPADSVKFGFGPASASYFLAPKATTGRYDYYSRIAYGNTDGVPSDNVNMFSQYINDSIFCKGSYDYVRGVPNVSIGIQPAGSTGDFELGPMFFSTRSNYSAQKIQFAISRNNTTGDTLEGSKATAVLMKWVDGSGGGTVDQVMEGSEVTIVGFTVRSFTATDKSGAVVTVGVKDPDGSDKRVMLDSNAWYWVAVQAQQDCFIGMDRTTSYFTRAYVQSQNLIADFPEAINVGDILSYVGVSNVAVSNFPFGGSADIDSVFFDRYNEIPAVALHLSKTAVGPGNNPGGVKNVNDFGSVAVYPNPAVSGYFNVSVKLATTANTVTYRLIDGMGRMIKDVVHTNVKNETFQYSTNGLAAGSYYLIVMDDKNGSLLQKVTVQ